MSDLNDLYRETILDHARHPRNLRAMPGADRHATGYNPLCGDRVEVCLDLDDGTIRDISFTGEGCAICLASASLMTEHLKGASVDAARAAFSAFHEMVTRGEPGDRSPLGKLAVLEGVRQYPMRVKCATLAWHTMKAALDRRDEKVTTE